MAVPVDEVIRRRVRPSVRHLALCVALLSVALVSGCTGDSVDGPSAAVSGPGRQPKPTQPAGRTDAELGKRVEEALGTAVVGDDDPLFVEAGLERVGDGMHSVPELARGRSYELSVVCAGSGGLRLSVALKNPVRRTVDCDGAMVRQRLTASVATVRIDGEGMKGATGMVGWRLDKAGR